VALPHCAVRELRFVFSSDHADRIHGGVDVFGVFSGDRDAAVRGCERWHGALMNNRAASPAD
jgi:hypothetical protein